MTLTRAHRWLYVLLVIHAGMLAWSAACHAPTVDEPFHLAAGIRNWQDGQFDVDRGNPPLVRLVAAVPVVLAGPRTDWSHIREDAPVGADFLDANGSRAFWLINLGRLACIPFSLLGGYFSFRWASKLYGPRCGLVALTLWCASPSIIANGPLITGDMAATAVGVTAFYAFWKWIREPSIYSAVPAGALLGLAQLAKFIWVLLYVLWPLLWIAWNLASRGETLRRRWRAAAAHLAIMVVLSLYVINLGYAFTKPFQPLRQFYLGERILRQFEALLPGDQPGAAPVLEWLGALPVPLPEDYLGGIEQILRKHVGRHPAYVRGQWQPNACWYYYLYAALIKLPLGTLALFGLACFLPRLFPGKPDEWKSGLLVLIPAAAVICLATFSGALKVFRYILPILPFLFIFASKTGRAFAGKRQTPAVLVGALVAWSVTSSLWIYPHSLSYFNELVGGPRRGHHHLIDSNIDWGQDLLYLREWLDRHPEARPLSLAYFGLIDPRCAGIEFSLPPSLPLTLPPEAEIRLEHLGPHPGWHAVSVNLLYGLQWSWVRDGKGGRQRAGRGDYEYFRYFSPVATAGYSIYVYHVDLGEADRVRRELDLPRLPRDGGDS